MRLFVQYDRQGRILCVASVEAMPEGQQHPFPGELEEGVAILEITPAKEFKAVKPLDIHEQYVVDVKKRKLAKKRS